MINKIILASKSEVRKKILNKYNINCEVMPSNIDEEIKSSTILVIFSKSLFIILPDGPDPEPAREAARGPGHQGAAGQGQGHRASRESERRDESRD